MATRETRRDRGRRRGLGLKAQLLAELRVARVGVSVSQRAMAAELGCSKSEYARLERGTVAADIVRLSETAAVLGLELSIGLHPAGQPIRDKGHQALIGRLRRQLAAEWRARAEVPFPAAGDPRWWDLVLRLGDLVVGVEAETRIRDIQALTRRLRGRFKDGGVDFVVLLLSDSRANRLLVDELCTAVGADFDHSPCELLAALRQGRALPGSGVILL